MLSFLVSVLIKTNFDGVAQPGRSPPNLWNSTAVEVNMSKNKMLLWIRNTLIKGMRSTGLEIKRMRDVCLLDNSGQKQ